MKVTKITPVHKSNKTKLFEEYYFDMKHPTFQLFVDMDGVLTDFDGRFNQLIHTSPSRFERMHGTESFVEEVIKHGTEFWSGMSWTAEGRELWNYLKKFRPTILSRPLDDEVSTMGKMQWLISNVGRTVPFMFAQEKEQYASSNRILIDDNFDNIDKWKKAGGVGILYISNEQTINELKKTIGLKD